MARSGGLLTYSCLHPQLMGFLLTATLLLFSSPANADCEADYNQASFRSDDSGPIRRAHALIAAPKFLLWAKEEIAQMTTSEAELTWIQEQASGPVDPKILGRTLQVVQAAHPDARLLDLLDMIQEGNELRVFCQKTPVLRPGTLRDRPEWTEKAITSYLVTSYPHWDQFRKKFLTPPPMKEFPADLSALISTSFAPDERFENAEQKVTFTPKQAYQCRRSHLQSEEMALTSQPLPFYRLRALSPDTAEIENDGLDSTERFVWLPRIRAYAGTVDRQTVQYLRFLSDGSFISEATVHESRLQHEGRELPRSRLDSERRVIHSTYCTPSSSEQADSSLHALHSLRNEGIQAFLNIAKGGVGVCRLIATQKEELHPIAEYTLVNQGKSPIQVARKLRYTELELFVRNQIRLHLPVTSPEKIGIRLVREDDTIGTGTYALWHMLQDDEGSSSQTQGLSTSVQQLLTRMEQIIRSGECENR